MYLFVKLCFIHLLQYELLLYSLDGRCLSRYSAYEFALGIKSVCWSPSSQFLAIGSYDEKVHWACIMRKLTCILPLTKPDHTVQVCKRMKSIILQSNTKFLILHLMMKELHFTKIWICCMFDLHKMLWSNVRIMSKFDQYCSMSIKQHK